MCQTHHIDMRAMVLLRFVGLIEFKERLTIQIDVSVRVTSYTCLTSVTSAKLIPLA